MIKRFRLTVVMLMVLFAQLQPIQLHAVMLDAETSGHVAGTLQHSHSQDTATAATASSDSDSMPYAEQTQDLDSEHASDCHPAHSLTAALYYEQLISPPGSTIIENMLIGFTPPVIIQDTPPPKTA